MKKVVRFDPFEELDLFGGMPPIFGRPMGPVFPFQELKTCRNDIKRRTILVCIKTINIK